MPKQKKVFINMNFKLKDEHLLIQKTSRDFAQNELLPGAVERDRGKIWPKEAVKKMGCKLP